MIDTLLRRDLLGTASISDPTPLSEDTGLDILEYPQGALTAKITTEPAFGLCCPGWTVDVFGAAAFGDQQGELYSVHASSETRIWRQFSLALQPFGGVGVGKSDTSCVAGLDLIFKHPILTAGAMTENIEGGGGVQQAGPRSWPRDGSHFNWQPQLGMGIRLDAGNDQTLLLGGRWVHISNGGTNRSSNLASTTSCSTGDSRFASDSRSTEW